jgi:hypothetical protein
MPGWAASSLKRDPRARWCTCTGTRREELRGCQPARVWLRPAEHHVCACSFCHRGVTVSSSTYSARLQPNRRVPHVELGKRTEVTMHSGSTLYSLYVSSRPSTELAAPVRHGPAPPAAGTRALPARARLGCRPPASLHQAPRALNAQPPSPTVLPPIVRASATCRTPPKPFHAPPPSVAISYYLTTRRPAAPAGTLIPDLGQLWQRGRPHPSSPVAG